MKKMTAGIVIRMSPEQERLILASDVVKRCQQRKGGIIFMQPYFPKDSNPYFRSIYIEREVAEKLRAVLRDEQGVAMDIPAASGAA